jgi:hypothetical protein
MEIKFVNTYTDTMEEYISNNDEEKVIENLRLHKQDCLKII